jgi:fluoride ion exporter CrcB/FEX
MPPNYNQSPICGETFSTFSFDILRVFSEKMGILVVENSLLSLFFALGEISHPKNR